MFIGKGGVGKTTLACATAMSYARAGSRVLVASLDQAHSLGDALGFRFPHDPGTVAGITTVVPGLEVIEIDSLALLEDRFREVTRLLSADTGHDHGIDLGALDPAELTGLPGVQELLMLVEITEYAGEDEWDVIVVDCPPSADMLRIVTAPDTLLGYLDRVWPPHARAMSSIGTDLRRVVLATTVQRIVTAVTEVRDLLADHGRTGARLITVAERVAVAESARVRSAAALLGLRLDAVVVNKVLPAVPEPTGPADTAHPAVHWYLNRRAEQHDVIAGLRRAMPEVPVLVAAHTGPEPVGVGSLAALSYAVDDAASVAASTGGAPREAGAELDTGPVLGNNPAEGGTRSGEPKVRLESGAGLHSVYAMRMHLPVADPATLRLGRVEDDLIVGADGVRRRVRLAPVLRRCTVAAAELDGGYLIVRFRPDPEVWPL
ncbi:ArsA family ATPase [Nocardia cyriacigeorgica]|uniref:ArsA family ATPase n=1 Tax=Nocardia cyriacigeorgica TaxID=135487 RepID=UPI000CEA1F78|nr:ArsA family ATPase [Nocardia cyriacigeorgica]AVH24461.1 argininosuccinate lyase [Nocardia cyriacigeorgica]MBF6323565.1 ArsA family ATPase [Nocardia cyriacigeorgica]MBF6496475.1 ArsA family ATPase [Nocardia cyriacigeorgica]PPJ15933.1 argininosuccinate lyase [Nocardia cyriacigeorgica]